MGFCSCWLFSETIVQPNILTCKRTGYGFFSSTAAYDHQILTIVIICLPGKEISYTIPLIGCMLSHLGKSFGAIDSHYAIIARQASLWRRIGITRSTWTKNYQHNTSKNTHHGPHPQASKEEAPHHSCRVHTCSSSSCGARTRSAPRGYGACVGGSKCLKPLHFKSFYDVRFVKYLR